MNRWQWQWWPGWRRVEPLAETKKRKETWDYGFLTLLPRTRKEIFLNIFLSLFENFFETAPSNCGVKGSTEYSTSCHLGRWSFCTQHIVLLNRKWEYMKDFIDTAGIGTSPSPKEESVSFIIFKLVHYIFHTSHTTPILWHRATKCVTLVSYTAAPPQKHTLHITMLTRKQEPAFIDWLMNFFVWYAKVVAK